MKFNIDILKKVEESDKPIVVETLSLCEEDRGKSLDKIHSICKKYEIDPLPLYIQYAYNCGRLDQLLHRELTLDEILSEKSLEWIDSKYNDCSGVIDTNISL